MLEDNRGTVTDEYPAVAMYLVLLAALALRMADDTGVSLAAKLTGVAAAVLVAVAIGAVIWRLDERASDKRVSVEGQIPAADGAIRPAAMAASAAKTLARLTIGWVVLAGVSLIALAIGYGAMISAEAVLALMA